MIVFDQVKFRYPRSEFQLDLPELRIADRETVAIVGPSGCGKTTLLNLIAGIEIPADGCVTVNDQPISSLSDAHRRNFRIANVGMVFQEFELIEYLDLKHNVLLPYLINQSLHLDAEVERRALALITDMGLGDKLNRRPHQLSQGEKQRVAICRALIAHPRILLADEPTGNLDPKNKRAILKLVRDQADRFDQTLVVVTHDVSILDDMDRVIDFETFRNPVVAQGASQ